MSERTNLQFKSHFERLVSLEQRVDIFQKEMRNQIKDANAKLDILLSAYHQAQGERNLARVLIGLLGAISGGLTGWLSHFWWTHP